MSDMSDIFLILSCTTKYYHIERCLNNDRTVNYNAYLKLKNLKQSVDL